MSQQLENIIHDLNTIGGRLNYLRSRLNLSQLQLAQALSDQGIAIPPISQKRISEFERDQRKPNAQQLMAFSAFFGANIPWIEEGKYAPFYNDTTSYVLPTKEPEVLEKELQQEKETKPYTIEEKIEKAYQEVVKTKRNQKIVKVATNKPDFNLIKRIKDTRLYFGDEQNKVGVRMGTKKSNSFCSSVENGKSIPSRKWLERFAKAYGVNLQWLLKGKGEMFHSNGVVSNNFQIESLSNSPPELSKDVVFDLRNHFKTFVSETSRILNITPAEVASLFEFFTSEKN